MNDFESAKTIEDMKQAIRLALPDLDVVIAWERGYDDLHATPLFIRSAEDVNRLVLDHTCVHTLAGYLPSMKDKKVGIVVKGCDSRAVAELLSEELILRENVTIFGFGCSGVVSLRRLARNVGSLSRVENGKRDGETLHLIVDGENRELAFDDVCAHKCGVCVHPNAVISDHFVGPEAEPRAGNGGEDRLQAFESLSLEERFEFWKEHMRRCVRCYACRNACPMCVCKDHCLAVSRKPRFLSQEATVSENLMFQLIHVSHLSGRCVGCGECERACPMGIPLGLLRAKSNKIMAELFNHEAGLNPETVPPLLSFKTEEAAIQEHKA